MINKTKAWIYGIPFLIGIIFMFYSYGSLLIQKEIPLYSLFFFSIGAISLVSMLYYFNKESEDKKWKKI